MSEIKCKVCSSNDSDYYLSKTEKDISAPEYYRPFEWAIRCSKCDSYIDYKEIPFEAFCYWLQHDAGNDRNAIITAIKRYFEP